MAVLTAVAPDRSTFIAPTTISGTNTVRKSVYMMTPQEISDYRLAVARIAKISAASPSDHRGYQYVAGIHGQPGQYCKHHTKAFAIWHRPYIQGYEQRLQDAVPKAFLPYWDWTTRRAQTEGIPQVFSDKTWLNPDTGKTEPNPLLSQPMSLIGRGPTSRSPQAPAGLTPLRNLVHTALLAPDYSAFSADMENPHDSVHMWVGDSMGSISFAAYDPLFWSHHCFVEYMFCQWQDAHLDALPPQMDPRDFAPFSVTIDKVWDYHALGYSYLPDNATDLRVANLSAGPGAATSNRLRSGATVASFPLDTIDPDYRRAEIRFEGLTPPEDSLAVRIFAGEEKVDAKTATDDNPRYLGTRYFFGHGECGGAEGHCEPVLRDLYDLRPAHHYAPVRVRVDVSKRLRDFIADRQRPEAHGQNDVPLTLVVVDREGREIAESDLSFQGLSVVIR
jgi:tyrosinase